MPPKNDSLSLKIKSVESQVWSGGSSCARICKMVSSLIFNVNHGAMYHAVVICCVVADADVDVSCVGNAYMAVANCI